MYNNIYIYLLGGVLMTRLLLLILMFSTGSLYSQDATKQTSKKRGYKPHSIAISQRIGGIGEIKNRISAGANGADTSVVIADGSEYKHFNNATTVIEFFTQTRKGRSQYTPMISFRFSFPFSSYDGLYGGFRWGVLLGGSQYLFDLRSKTTGLGWSMLANGGFILDIGEVTSLHYPVILGGEVDFKVIYNIHKYVGITFGLNMGYQVSFDGTKANTTSGAIPEAIINNGFSWNLNFGVMF